MEMNRMKEENKVSRKVVEEKMKDYHALQMKFTTNQLNNQEKVNLVSLFIESVRCVMHNSRNT
jgi:hypothetical protein